MIQNIQILSNLHLKTKFLMVFSIRQVFCWDVNTNRRCILQLRKLTVRAVVIAMGLLDEWPLRKLSHAWISNRLDPQFFLSLGRLGAQLWSLVMICIKNKHSSCKNDFGFSHQRFFHHRVTYRFCWGANRCGGEAQVGGCGWMGVCGCSLWSFVDCNGD